ncbi:MAG: class I SAM-dependent methyltransferase [Lachnospiraceae bacterium]|nr:class I SAM-dependent methyltransferase [Lachnospiraceae bacterium]
MYDDFAYVYDELMDNVPYKDWADMLDEIIREEGISIPNSEAQDGADSERNQVLDLACGTGTLTELMYKKGYDMIGVDVSESMLNVAYEKRDRNNSEILYLNQDMTELDLYSTVGTIYCLCDSINYITDMDDLKTVFSLVYNYLYTGGIFIFDFNTVHKYRDVIGDRTIAENRDECSFIWENSYTEEDAMNEYDLTVFVKTEESGSGECLFKKFEETHYQCGYEYEEMLEYVRSAGFKIVRCFDDKNSDLVEEDAERIYVVARK